MENIENLGLYLKQLREERKIPLTQIAQALKSKPETIQAIESNDFSKIPAATYVKGYLRSYANLLGIDSEQILAEYNKQYPTPTKQILVLEGQKLPRIGFEIKAILKSKIFIYSTISIIVLIAIIIFLAHKPWKKITAVKEPAPVEKTAQKEQKQIEKQQATIPAPPSPANILNAPIALPISLIAQSQENVWIRVFSDNKLIFEGTIQKGEKETWKAEKEFKLKLGKPSKLNLTVNGQNISPLTQPGPLNIVINEQGIKVEK